MPAFYAHNRFGREVLGQLRGELKEIIVKHRIQYDIGLQGPDIFFFYRPWFPNRVARYGHHLHDMPADRFFRHGCRVIRSKGRDSAEYAYLLGVICHFMLDSECHPYIRLMLEEHEVSHLEMEEEFEKHLLRMDGQDPLSYPLADMIPTDEETVRAIHPFYSPQMTEQTVQRSLIWYQRIKKLFTVPGELQQNVINALLHLTGHYKELKGLMHQRIDNPECEQSSTGLQFLLEDAVEETAELMKQFDACVRTGEPLPDRFSRSFA
jgi:hypothetical protein